MEEEEYEFFQGVLKEDLDVKGKVAPYLLQARYD